MKPHKHADLIKAWADGAEIEEWQEHLQAWETDKNPTWFTGQIYRIKPVTNHERLVYLKLKFTIEQKDEYWKFTNVELLNE
jgi:hypothetical protein